MLRMMISILRQKQRQQKQTKQRLTEAIQFFSLILAILYISVPYHISLSWNYLKKQLLFIVDFLIDYLFSKVAFFILFTYLLRG